MNLMCWITGSLQMFMIGLSFLLIYFLYFRDKLKKVLMTKELLVKESPAYWWMMFLPMVFLAFMLILILIKYLIMYWSFLSIFTGKEVSVTFYDYQYNFFDAEYMFRLSQHSPEMEKIMGCWTLGCMTVFILLVAGVWLYSSSRSVSSLNNK